MQYRPLGRTELRISEIGFGAWGIGGVTTGATSYGETDDAESKRALRAAFDAGINFYDTSDLYGYGHSEELIGEAFESVRHQVVIASKVGFLEHRGQQDFSRRHIRQSLEGSLRRLRTDYLDLYQLHSPPIALLLDRPEILGTLRSLQAEGKIRAFGVSVRHPDDALVVMRQLRCHAVQVNFSMIDQRIVDNGFADLAGGYGVGIIARTPLCFGFLSGKLTRTEFDERDHRSSWSKEQLEAWRGAADFFSGLNEGKERTAAQLALKFCLSFPAVASTIPGILHPNQAVENAAASEAPSLSPADLDSIREIWQHNVFFRG